MSNQQATLFKLPPYGVAYCAICGRELTAPQSIAAGIGPVCIHKGNGETMEGEYTPHLILDADPRAHGFILRRDKSGRALTNVPQIAIHHSPTGFEFGYGGSGPADLALNILEFVIVREKMAQGGRVSVWKGTVSRRAWEMHHDFKFQFIGAIPKKDGGVIPYQTVVDWIAAEPLDPYEDNC